MGVFKSKQPFHLPPHFSVDTDVENRIHQAAWMQIYLFHCMISLSYLVILSSPASSYLRLAAADDRHDPVSLAITMDTANYNRIDTK